MAVALPGMEKKETKDICILFVFIITLNTRSYDALTHILTTAVEVQPDPNPSEEKKSGCWC